MNTTKSSLKGLIAIVILMLPCIVKGQIFTKVYSPGDSITKQGYGYLARHVLFKLDKAQFNDSIPPSLDSIAVFLNRQDNIRIEIGVHGSTRNKASDCSRLTQGRAKTIYDYLITKGVNPQKMVPKGYGQNKLLYSDAQIKKTQNKALVEMMNSKNRRVEFIILRKDFKSNEEKH